MIFKLKWQTLYKYDQIINLSIYRMSRYLYTIWVNIAKFCKINYCFTLKIDVI